ncbi:unnamed protein product [Adineta ricciae]|uniref:Uncharacterized protein n=2 Tax=Adineta ricciae TaxID=249248 RepID=A0A815X1X5_ADIRI|nr:unnamed protein product [Adineta ricciae]
MGNSAVLSSVELYDPLKVIWTSSTSMSIGRYEHTASVVKTGMVLVTGGLDSYEHLINAELYDPIANVWMPTGNMSHLRYGHAASVIGDGQVLITGGYDLAVLRSAELYNAL